MTSFVRSPEFAASAVIGILLAGGFLTAPALFPGLTTYISDECPTPIGEPVSPDQDHQGDTRRALAYQAPPGTDLRVCIHVGKVHILPHDQDFIGFDVRISGDGTHAERSVAGTEIALARSGDTLHLAQTQSGRVTWWLGGSSAAVEVTIHVPRQAALSYDVELDVGDVTARGLNGTGDHRWHVDVGDMDVSYDALDNGSIEVTHDVGNVHLALPDGPGYHLDAATDVGAIDNRLPDMRLIDRDNDPAGESLVAQSDHYETAATRVDLHVRVDVGDIHVSGPPR